MSGGSGGPVIPMSGWTHRLQYSRMFCHSSSTRESSPVSTCARISAGVGKNLHVWIAFLQAASRISGSRSLRAETHGLQGSRHTIPRILQAIALRQGQFGRRPRTARLSRVRSLGLTPFRDFGPDSSNRPFHPRSTDCSSTAWGSWPSAFSFSSFLIRSAFALSVGVARRLWRISRKSSQAGCGTQPGSAKRVGFWFLAESSAESTAESDLHRTFSSEHSDVFVRSLGVFVRSHPGDRTFPSALSTDFHTSRLALFRTSITYPCGVRFRRM
jgi:hypothetical protein